jgi:hypothetical protein
MASTGSGKAESVIETKTDKPKRERKVKRTVFQNVPMDICVMDDVEPGMTIEKLQYGNQRITVTTVIRKSASVIIVNGRNENAGQRVIVRNR